ncbi:hypothetical protein EON81_09270 [bacterium]|nr:MAG: hypothetical protein EON81_09270 [bacterium]
MSKSARKPAFEVRYLPPLLAVLIAGGGVAVFWPKGRIEIPWEKAVAATLGAPRLEVHIENPKSQEVINVYQDGDKYSKERTSGASQYLVRDDGEHHLNYSRSDGIAWLDHSSTIKGESIVRPDSSPAGVDVIGLVLDAKGKFGEDEVLRQREPIRKVDGFLRCVLDFNGVPSGEIFIIVLLYPETFRLRKIEYWNAGEKIFLEEIDYPTSIPSEKFTLVPPSGAKVRKIPETRELVRKLLRKGGESQRIGSRTVTLLGTLASPNERSLFVRVDGPPGEDIPRLSIKGINRPIEILRREGYQPQKPKLPPPPKGARYYAFLYYTQDKKPVGVRVRIGNQEAEFKAAPMLEIPSIFEIVPTIEFDF